jgi:hypothetical protein
MSIGTIYKKLLPSLILVTLVLLVGSHRALAEECTHLWTHDLEVSPTRPKGLSGDTNAGYAMLSFRPERNLKLVLQGRFPSARFLSFETYATKFLKKGDSLIDLQMVPYPGSTNPFRSGVISQPQFYEIQVGSAKSLAYQGINTLEMSSRLFAQAIMMRIYDPTAPLNPAVDLPRVYAVDEATGTPRACPRWVNIPYFLDFPQIVGALAPRTPELIFHRSGDVSGGNAAIPGYIYALSELNPDDIALIKYQPMPARYASFCVQNFLKNETLACLPDRLTQVSSDHNAYIAISENQDLLRKAQELGWNTLPFIRDRNQRMMGFVYRNLLPSQPDSVYQGPYEPRGVLCSAHEFLSGNCRVE